MFLLPPTIAPPQPFPLVVAQSIVQEFVAPGVSRAELHLQTTAGPLTVHLVTVDPAEPSVRLGVVLAHNRLVSSGETVSAMAVRTNAIAGVNADYFDIGHTNQPLNIVVQDGRLVRSPSQRIAFLVSRDKEVTFAHATLGGSVSYGSADVVPLTGLNIWPPEGGASLMTPDYGPLVPRPGVTTVGLTASDSPGRYTVTDPSEAGTQLAFGPAASAIAAPPALGTSVDLTLTLLPDAAGIAQAAGGGPLLVAQGRAYADPNEPAPQERNIRFPVSGAALLPGGKLVLVAVDGRLPAESMGLTRPEFSALMLGLGATDAMAFDSGGSATLVARQLGDERPSLLNAPSDGHERPVADGIFVYSDAPIGVHGRLFARLAKTSAFGGATIPVQGALVDDAGHRLRPVQLASLVADLAPGDHRATLHSGPLAATVEYRTVDRVARLVIDPSRPNPDPGTEIVLEARGADALHWPVALDTVRWTAQGGSIRGQGTSAVFRAGQRDGEIEARVGSVSERIPVAVGRHDERLGALAPALAARWRFSTVPAGAPGTLRFLEPDPGGGGPVLSIPYDLRAERAAYAVSDVPLPGTPLRFALDIDGDGNGIGLRAQFVNRLGERESLTLAARLDWTGWRHMSIELPAELNPPIHLLALYAVPLGQTPLQPTGEVRVRDLAVTLPGNP